jgi:hypothetical protein
VEILGEGIPSRGEDAPAAPMIADTPDALSGSSPGTASAERAGVVVVAESPPLEGTHATCPPPVLVLPSQGTPARGQGETSVGEGVPPGEVPALPRITPEKTTSPARAAAKGSLFSEIVPALRFKKRRYASPSRWLSYVVR